MRFIGAIAAVCLVLPGPAAAFDLLNPSTWFAPSTCPMVIPAVSVRSPRSGVVIDQTKDASGMDLAARTLAGASRAGWTTNGLAIAEIRSRADLITNQVELNDGRWCATLHEAVVSIGYSDPIKVLISKRYAKFSCQYGAILEHESLHVDIYRQTLAAHLRDAESRIMDQVLAAGPAYGATPALASAGIEKVIDDAVLEIIEGVKAESARRNSVLDTDTSYFAIQAQCPSW